MTQTARPTLQRTATRQAALAELPAALRSLWRVACGEGSDVSRALTVNFVAIAPIASLTVLRDAADRLMQRSPARAFLLAIDDSLATAQAEVTVATRGQGSHRDVVLEEIFVRMPRTWFPHVPGLVRPLLINDLPNHLYWADDWADGREFDALCGLCEHRIVDSRRFQVPCVQLQAVAERQLRGTAITDLSWLRLRPWRRALAEAFERIAWQPGAAPRGVLRHGKNGVATAILLASWLEAQLGAELALEESATGDDACPDAVTLRWDGFEVEASATGKRITVHVTTKAQCFLPFRLPSSQSGDGDLLAAAIDIA